jgi:hypothetical protein
MPHSREGPVEIERPAVLAKPQLDAAISGQPDSRDNEERRHRDEQLD